MNRQKGFATLLASVVMVSLVTISVFVGQKGSVLEQRAANNAYRTEQAFENAENGLRVMIAQLKATLAASPTATLQNTSISSGSYTVTYDAVTQVISSTGLSASGSSRQIHQRIDFTPGTPPIIGTPVEDALTALGDIFVGGNASVESVKSGGSVSTGGSADIGSVNTSDFFQKIIVNGVEEYLLKADGTKIKLTEDEYFLRYFGNLCPVIQEQYNALRAIAGTTSVALAQQADGCKAEAKITVAARDDGYVCASGCVNADLQTQYDAGKRIMWLTEGGMKINANVTLGSVDDPVLIFVMESGTVQINGTSKVYGVVYVDVPKVSETVTNVTGSVPCSCTASRTKLGNGANNWSSISYDVAASQDAACTVSVCQAELVKCTPAGGNLATGTVSSCTYATSAPVGDVEEGVQTEVTIEVLGTWDNSGGGNALIEGAALTSGNFSTTGGIELVRNTGVVDDFQEGTSGDVEADVSGWSDLPLN